MKYFKNTELAKLYNVSEKTVRNWIQATLDGKLDLQLYTKDERPYVANTSKNASLIKSLVQKGKKFKNTRGFRVISPTEEFYTTYSSKQVFDIISCLTIHNELPLKYGYLDGGAEYWDTYAKRLFQEPDENVINSTERLIQSNLDRLGMLLSAQNRRVNVIDLGPGNALPTKSILGYLLERNLLNRYAAVDISHNMLSIAKANLDYWFDGVVPFEGYVRDLEYEQFDDLFAKEYAGDDADIPINLVIMLGGTLCNFRNPDHALRTINNSIGADDWFVYSMKLDTPNSRRHFDFSVTNEHQELSPRHKLVADLLNIDTSLYEVEYSFSEASRARSITIRPKIDLTIRFELKNGTRQVDLRKDRPVLLWRSWQWTALDVIKRFDRMDFDLMHASKSTDKEYLLLVSKIKTKR